MMKEELYKNLNEFKSKDFTEINNKIIKTKEELKKFNQNIDNILFCLLQKEVIRSNELLDKTYLSNSQEILSLKSLTKLSILPQKNSINNNINHLYFLLSNNKAKNICPTLTPFEFWTTLLKFLDVEKKLSA